MVESDENKELKEKVKRLQNAVQINRILIIIIFFYIFYFEYKYWNNKQHTQ